MWEYIFVGDVAAAVAAALDCDAIRAFSRGSGRPAPLSSIMDSLRDLSEPAMALAFGQVPYRPDQVMYLEAGITAPKTAIGWEPCTTSLEHGLEQTLEWHREWRRRP